LYFLYYALKAFSFLLVESLSSRVITLSYWDASEATNENPQGYIYLFYLIAFCSILLADAYINIDDFTEQKNRKTIEFLKDDVKVAEINIEVIFEGSGYLFVFIYFT
jgi:TRAP-type C4-dicarboxylate transport system permease small subunit